MKQPLKHFARKLLYSTIGRRNFEHRYHRRSKSLRKAPIARSSGATVDDALLVSQIVEAYRKQSHRAFGESIWTGFYNELHRDLHSTLMTGTHEQVAALLRDPASSDLFYGFENLTKSLLRAPRLEDTEDPYQAWDSLICFAEAMGVVRLENPETYGLKLPSASSDADEILDLIEKRLGVTLPIPNPYPNELGLRTRRGVVSYRAAQAMYQAWKIRELVSGSVKPKVVEIGAGLGRTALYASALGVRDYTIVDIPISLVAQRYFLGRAGVACKFQTPQEFLSDTAHYDLAVNVDSLTELDRTIAEQYIAALAARAERLLSINHEANAFTVAQLTGQYQTQRTASWNRRGYVEEVIDFARQQAVGSR